MKIVVLTGAGLSVASGLKTFRGATGVYNYAAVSRLSHAGALRTHPDDLWKFWGALRGEINAASPNAAHHALAALEKRLGADDTLTIVTMNVDGLHLRAGSTNVLELHGSLMHSRCTTVHCSDERHRGRFVDSDTRSDGAPYCSADGTRRLVRPDIVLFGESLPTHVWSAAKNAARHADVFIAVGTSNTVAPASDLVSKPYYKGADTIFVNPEVPLGLRCFRRKIVGKAEEVLPDLLEALIPTARSN
ncbi:MAG: hypothetical protein K2W95_34140 [Candidatus Obscuribacterales bacterium]|nr:hypothetical protein [Candidatus Obscuribacterales bacterium]